jgi:hypothetical protein
MSWCTLPQIVVVSDRLSQTERIMYIKKNIYKNHILLKKKISGPCDISYYIVTDQKFCLKCNYSCFYCKFLHLSKSKNEN